MLLWAFLALLTEPAGLAGQYGCLMLKNSRAILALKVAASWVVVHCCRKLQVAAETKLTLHVQPWIHFIKAKVISMLYNLLMILCLFSVTMVRMVCCSSLLSFSNSSRLEKNETALNRNRCVSILHQNPSFFLLWSFFPEERFRFSSSSPRTPFSSLCWSGWAVFKLMLLIGRHEMLHFS